MPGPGAIASETLTQYDPLAQIVTTKLGPITGWGADSGVRYEPLADLGELDVGLDGSVTWSSMPQTAIRANLTVREGTRGYRRLKLLQDLQKAERIKTPIDYAGLDSNSGDKMVASFGFFVNPVYKDQAKKAGEKTFTIILINPQDVTIPNPPTVL